MNSIFTPNKNYHLTKKQIGYVPHKQAKEEDYQRIGFMCRLGHVNKPVYPTLKRAIEKKVKYS
ncbi:hypothetical protein [Labilibaculum antarcticum]|nr:hypothetical protein [Labilibaculum antarcticum]